jgi:hypothetical protein
LYYCFEIIYIAGGVKEVGWHKHFSLAWTVDLSLNQFDSAKFADFETALSDLSSG